MTSGTIEQIFTTSLRIYSIKPNDKHGNKGRNQNLITSCIKKVRMRGFLSQWAVKLHPTQPCPCIIELSRTFMVPRLVPCFVTIQLQFRGKQCSHLFHLGNSRSQSLSSLRNPARICLWLAGYQVRENMQDPRVPLYYPDMTRHGVILRFWCLFQERSIISLRRHRLPDLVLPSCQTLDGLQW